LLKERLETCDLKRKFENFVKGESELWNVWNWKEIRGEK
jgi:hypothetical protein